MTQMRHSLSGSLLVMWAALLSALILAACGGEEKRSAKESGAPMILASTSSTQDSGLLDVLVPAFEKAKGYRVKTVAVGSGEAIELGGRGEADVLLVHSPDAEKDLMKTGKAGGRRVVMHNDFVVVGPGSDPARVKGKASAAAFKRIADGQAPFISRGDDSGTHKFELKLWESAGLEPNGRWYQESGQGMGATLRIASEKDAYALSDRGTYLTTKDSSGLDIAVEGESYLLNVYHVIDMGKRAGPRVNEAGARAFADWIVSPEAQRMIREFGREKYGEPLFVPDAGKSEREVTKAA